MYKGEISDPKLVLQTEMQVGAEEIQCAVTHSAFFLNQPTGARYWVPAKGLLLTVERENGETVSMDDSSLNEDNAMLHVPLATPLQAGEEVRIRATHPDYPAVSAADTIVPMPEFSVASCNWDSVNRECRLRLVFGDNADFHGIMGVKGMLCHTEKYNWQGRETYNTYYSHAIASKDNVFFGMGNSFSSERGYNTLSELFFRADDARNKEIDVTLMVQYQTGNRSQFRQDSVQITVTAHSTHSYQYKKSLYSYFGATGSDDSDVEELFSDIIGIEEKVQLYSNVKDGYGIVAGNSKNIQTIIIKAQ